MSHFAQRANERGYTGDGIELQRDLRRAFALFRQGDRLAHDFVDLVRRLPDGSCVWRFNTDSGQFFAVERNGNPVTFLTKEQVQFYRERSRRKGRAMKAVKRG